METYDLHYTVIQRMPSRIRDALAVVDFNDFEKISQALSQFDLTYQERINQRRNIPNENNSDNRGSQSRSHRQRGEISQTNQSRERQTRVVNSHIQSYRFHENENQAMNLTERNSYPRVPLPDTISSPPPICFHSNDKMYSHHSNHLNY